MALRVERAGAAAPSNDTLSEGRVHAPAAPASTGLTMSASPPRVHEGRVARASCTLPKVKLTLRQQTSSYSDS